MRSWFMVALTLCSLLGSVVAQGRAGARRPAPVPGPRAERTAPVAPGERGFVRRGQAWAPVPRAEWRMGPGRRLLPGLRGPALRELLRRETVRQLVVHRLRQRLAEGQHFEDRRSAAGEAERPVRRGASARPDGGPRAEGGRFLGRGGRAERLRGAARVRRE